MGLLDADEDGRGFGFSTLDCVEFCLARADAGLGTGTGTGEFLPPLAASAKVPTTGEEAIDGDMAMPARLAKS